MLSKKPSLSGLIPCGASLFTTIWPSPGRRPAMRRSTCRSWSRKVSPNTWTFNRSPSWFPFVITSRNTSSARSPSSQSVTGNRIVSHWDWIYSEILQPTNYACQFMATLSCCPELASPLRGWKRTAMRTRVRAKQLLPAQKTALQRRTTARTPFFVTFLRRAWLGGCYCLKYQWILNDEYSYLASGCNQAVGYI